MSKATRETRHGIEHHLDLLEMTAFNEGFEACLNAIDELSNIKHNRHELIFAEHLRETLRELRGENVNDDA